MHSASVNSEPGSNSPLISFTVPKRGPKPAVGPKACALRGSTSKRTLRNGLKSPINSYDTSECSLSRRIDVSTVVRPSGRLHTPNFTTTSPKYLLLREPCGSPGRSAHSLAESIFKELEGTFRNPTRQFEKKKISQRRGLNLLLKPRACQAQSFLVGKLVFLDGSEAPVRSVARVENQSRLGK